MALVLQTLGSVLQGRRPLVQLRSSQVVRIKAGDDTERETGQGRHAPELSTKGTPARWQWGLAARTPNTSRPRKVRHRIRTRTQTFKEIPTMPTRVRREALTRAVQANEMTQRAKWYLAVASCRHLLTGIIALTLPGTFKSTSFLPILEAAPLWFWACIFVGAGLACGTAAVTGHEAIARLGMAWSATSTLVVGIALTMSVFSGQLASPTGPILWLAVAFKDFVVCAQPIRSPFEGLAQRLAEKQQDK